MGHLRHFERVRALVSAHSGVPEAEIGMETRLVEDLGLDGDDGHEFLEVFADAFGIDMCAMAPRNYFSSEGTGFPAPSLVGLAARCLPKFGDWVRHATRGRRSLSVRDLVATARALRWLGGRGPAIEYSGIWPGLLLAMTVAGLGAWGLGGAEPLALAAAAVLLALLGLRFLSDLARLRSLDAAAAFEEQAVAPAR